MNWIGPVPRFVFFTGKGGVGKTSLSCALAIKLADSGKRVLLVSTDPASNLSQVLASPVGSDRVAIAGVDGLTAMNVDPQAAAAAYRQEMVDPYRGVLPDEIVAGMEEQLSGACAVEIAAFEAFAKLLGQPDLTADYDHVVLDTAPTGHTLRLLQLPAAWDTFLENNERGSSCLGPLAGLKSRKELYSATVESLKDADATTIVLVSRPRAGALNEAARTYSELLSLGVNNQRLVINGMLAGDHDNDPVAARIAGMQSQALANLPEALADLPRTDMPLRPFDLTGPAALRAVLDESAPPPEPQAAPSETNAPALGDLGEMIDNLASAGRGVIMTMGKGGVGKTTLASVIAVRLARSGKPVHLTTTDPAAHLNLSLGDDIGGLTVSRIDPAAETLAYSEEVLAGAGAEMDDQARELLEEDLRSPCTEEIAVFRAFAQQVDAGADGFVVIDTAPTGHTLLLLDATQAYHRQMGSAQGDLPEPVKRLLPRLRDPDYTKVIVVALPEPTPVQEAVELQNDLARAGITPHAWVINRSLTPLETQDPVLSARRANEAAHIRAVADSHAPAGRAIITPWLSDPLGELTQQGN
jgi:arsenite/tail-anchored protein-transporting ATPase